MPNTAAKAAAAAVPERHHQRGSVRHGVRQYQASTSQQFQTSLSHGSTAGSHSACAANETDMTLRPNVSKADDLPDLPSGPPVVSSRVSAIISNNDGRYHDADSVLSSSADDRIMPTYEQFRLTHILVGVPAAIIIMVLFGLLLLFGWPDDTLPYPHNFHWHTFGLGCVAWLASESLRSRLFRALAPSISPQRQTCFNLPDGFRSVPLALLAHTLFLEVLRLFSIHILASILEDYPPLLIPSSRRPVLRPPEGFYKAFALGLGFASTEALWRTLQLLRATELYREVLVQEGKNAWLTGEEAILYTDGDASASLAGGPIISSSHSSMQNHTSALQTEAVSIINDDTLELGKPFDLSGADDYRDEVSSKSLVLLSDEELDGLVRERKRCELESSFGCPLYDVPIAIVIVWRLDATLLNLALTLAMSIPFQNTRHDRRHAVLPVSLPVWPTFFALVIFHWILSLLWSISIGLTDAGWLGRDSRLPAVSYATLMLVLFVFFASLAAWNALI